MCRYRGLTFDPASAVLMNKYFILMLVKVSFQYLITCRVIHPDIGKECSNSTTLTKLYCSFIRPYLDSEYASIVWNPGLKGEVDALENVQKFTLQMCTKQWSSSYDELLSSTSLPSLKERRTQASLCHLYKIIHGETVCRRTYAAIDIKVVTALALLSNMLFF